MELNGVGYTVTGDTPPARNDCAALELTCDRTPFKATIAVFAGMVRGGANFERDEYFNDVHLLEVAAVSRHWQVSDENSYTLRWVALACTGDAPSRRSGAAASLLSATNTLVTFGGGTLWTNGEVHNDVHSLNISSREWVRQDTVGQPPPARQGHMAMALNESGEDVLYLGGSDNVQMFDDFYILHTNSWRFSMVQHDHGSCPISNMAGASVDRFIDGPEIKAIVFGGASWQELVADVSSDVYVVDISNGEASFQWQRISHTKATGKKKNRQTIWPHSRFAHATCFLDSEHLLMHGGWGFREDGDEEDDAAGGGEDLFFGDFKAYSTFTNSWCDVRCNSKLYCRQRFGHKMFCLRHLGVVVGVCGNNGLHPLNDVFLLAYNVSTTRIEFEAPSSSSSSSSSSSPAAGTVMTKETILDDFYCPSAISKQFRSILDKGLFSDVKINVSPSCNNKTDAPSHLHCAEGESSAQEIAVFCAHKCVLAARSEVFTAMLNSSFRESSEGVIHIEDSSPTVFAAFLQCLYGSDVSDILSFDNLLGVLDLANRYQVLEVKYECEVSLCMQANADNVVSLIGYANDYSCPYVLRRCLDVVKKIKHNDDLICSIRESYPNLWEPISLYMQSQQGRSCAGVHSDGNEKKRKYDSTSSSSSCT